MRKKLKIIAMVALAFFVSFSFIMASVQESDAATRTFYLYKGSKIYYANTKTVYKYVKINGVVRDAYCLEPSKDAPPKGNHSASTISTASAVARVLYFSRLAPGESQFRAYLRASGMGDRCSTNNKYYAFIHVLLARAYQGEPKCWKIVEGGTLQAKYKNDVKKAYNWIMAQSIITDSAFSVRNGSASTVTAQYDIDTDTYTTKSTPFTMYGDAKQYFGFSVPKNATMYLKRRGSSSYGTYGAGASVNIYGGDSFYFVFNGNGTSFSRTAYGALASIIPWQMNYGSSKQDVGFFENTKSSSAAFGVTINKVDTGRIWLEKKKEMPGGDDAIEANTKFMVWKSDTYANAAAAKAANTKNRPVYAEIVTGADGTITSGKLVTGTYTVSQMTSPDGYKKVPNETVTVTKDQITKVNNGDYLLNELMPLKIIINKTNAQDGTLITESDATFGIYADAACTREFEQVTTVDGVATSSALEEGIYYIKEVEAPEDYVLNKEVKKVVLSYDTTNLNMSTECFEYTIDRFDNLPLTYHDINITKKLRGEYEPGTQVTFNIELRGLEQVEEFLQLAYSDSYDAANQAYETHQEQINIDEDGNLSKTITLTIEDLETENRTGGFITLTGVPCYAEYKITEVVDSDVYKRASYAVTLGGDYVSMPQDSLIPDGEENLSSGWQAFPASQSDPSYDITYQFTNSTEDEFDLIIDKSVAGVGASKREPFSFNIALSGLPQEGAGSFMRPGYIIYETDASGGTGKAIASYLPEQVTTPMATIKLQLKANQAVKLFGLAPGTEYSIVEKPHEGYESSWEAESSGALALNDTGGDGDPAEGEIPQNTDSETLLYHYTNTHDGNPKLNSIVVTKDVNPAPDTAEDFDVTIEVSGAKANGRYAVMKTRENDPYDSDDCICIRVPMEISSVYPDATAEEVGYPFYLTDRGEDYYSPCTFVGGVVCTIERADGATRTYTTNSEGVIEELYTDAFKEWAAVEKDEYGVCSLYADVLGMWLEFFPVDEYGQQVESADEIWGYDMGWMDPSDYGDELYQSLKDPAYECDALFHTNYKYIDTEQGTGFTVQDTIQDGEQIVVVGLPEGASYTVTEGANDYTPSYAIERYSDQTYTSKKLDSDTGTPKEDMTTDTQTFNGQWLRDTVALTNKLEYEDLEVTKTVDKGEKNKKFDFTVELENLKAGKTYTVISNGTDSYPISITADGDITITGTAQDSSPLSAAGIDVMLTRPDGEQKLYTTNANGVIPNTAYRSWLLAGCNRNATTANFKADYLNGSATFNVNYIEWNR